MGKLASSASRLNNRNVPNTRMEEKSRKKRNQELTLATLNVRTLRTEVELAHALEEIKLDILGLSEVRRTGEATVEKENGNYGATKGKPRVKEELAS